MLATLLSLGSELFDLVAPHRCASCDEPFPTFPPRAPAGASIGRLAPAPALCATCAAALEPAQSPPAGVVAAYAHGGPLARAIHRAKYGESPAPARRLGALLVHATRDVLAPADVALPVPLHPSRLRARGYNQAVEIARGLRLPIAFDAVARVRDTPSQVGLDRATRLVNVRGAFAPRSPRALAGARVLIVDDVVTTGATLAEVAVAARSAGARSVACVTLARMGD